MKYIRIGNDFALLWKVKRADKVEDLRDAVDMELKCLAGGSSSVVDFELVGRDTVRVEINPQIASSPGVYPFELSYRFPNPSYSDGYEDCETDVDAFRIVPRTAQADEITELEVCSDVLIGLRGKAFESEDFTPEEREEIQRPAIEAAARADAARLSLTESVNQTIVDIETRTDAAIRGANSSAQLADSKAQLADDATTTAINKVNEIDGMLTDWVQVEALIVAEEQRRVQADLRRDQKEAAMDAAEQIRVENDLERIGSIAGTEEFNEINIQ